MTAAVALAGVIAIAHRPGHSAATASTAAPRVAIVPQHHPVSGHPVLLRLADDVTQAPAPPGNATLVVRHHTFPDQTDFWGYDLYEDSGAYYYGGTLDQLRQSLADPGNGDKELGGILTAAAHSANATPAQAASAIYQAAPAPSGPPPTKAELRVTLQKAVAAKASPRLIRMIRRQLHAILPCGKLDRGSSKAETSSPSTSIRKTFPRAMTSTLCQAFVERGGLVGIVMPFICSVEPGDPIGST